MDKRITIRLAANDYLKVEAMAKRDGRKLADYCRRAVLADGEVPKKIEAKSVHQELPRTATQITARVRKGAIDPKALKGVMGGLKVMT